MQCPNCGNELTLSAPPEHAENQEETVYWCDECREAIHLEDIWDFEQD